MNSPFAHIILELQELLSAQAPQLAYIAADTGQLSAKGRPAVAWPCLLIDFEDWTFTNQAGSVQTATGIVLLSLCTQPLSDTDHLSPLPSRADALQHLELEWHLHKLLHGWAPTAPYMGKLIRMAAKTKTRTEPYRIRELRYKLSFEDDSLRAPQLYAPAQLQVSASIPLPLG